MFPPLSPPRFRYFHYSSALMLIIAKCLSRIYLISQREWSVTRGIIRCFAGWPLQHSDKLAGTVIVSYQKRTTTRGNYSVIEYIEKRAVRWIDSEGVNFIAAKGDIQIEDDDVLTTREATIEW